MKIPLNWLKDYVDVRLSVDDLAHRLTMAGLNVEGVHREGATDVLEIEITPNRPDWLSVIGTAREVAAVSQKKLKVPAIKSYKVTKGSSGVSVEDKKDCGRYIATVIRGVKVGPSPAWLKERIEAIGIRPINNIVDITNFCLMEFGQPLHAFDYDKLVDGKISVRRAKDGEKIRTLDGIDRLLDKRTLVIADGKNPVALAGIMGGEETSVTGSTVNILLESAHFDMGLIRRTTRLLGLTSDSAYRFERNVDFKTIETGANRATDLILQLAGGKVFARQDLSPVKLKRAAASVQVTLSDIENLLGEKVSLNQAKSILTRLSCSVRASGKTALKVIAPHFRADLKQSVDFIEEIARIIGYDNLSMSLPRIRAVNVPADLQRQKVKETVYGTLLSQGFDEIVTFSMISRKVLASVGLGHVPAVKVHNPLSAEQEFMRPSLLPSLLTVAATNINRGNRSFNFFEWGRIYTAEKEMPTLGMVCCGPKNQDWRTSGKTRQDFYDLKGAMELFLGRLKIKDVEFLPLNSGLFEGGQAATIYISGKEAGALGKVSGKVLGGLDIKQGDVYFAELNLEALYAHQMPDRRFQPLPEYPSVVRDISLAVRKNVPYKRIEEICQRNGGAIFKSVQLVEQYLGEKIDPGSRGIVFSLTYQSVERTLRDEEVQLAHQSICDALVSELNAVLR